MPRKPTIKWRESDAEKLEKQVKRYNEKIYRTRHRHPELADILPDTIKKKDKLQMIEGFQVNPRSEFEKTIKSLNRFTQKGAEKAVVSDAGFKTTKWEVKEHAINVAQLNRERAKERARVENFDATSQGQSLGLKRGEMGSERMNELKPKKFDFNKIRNKTEWEKAKKGVQKQITPDSKNTRKEMFKQNYLKALENVYGDHASEIRSLIEELPADIVVDTYYKEQEATITFHYEPQEMQAKLDILENIWQGVSDDFSEKIYG